MTRFMVAMVSSIINWVIFYKIALHFDSAAPIFMATAIVSAILIHEIGHWLAMEHYGIRAGIVLLVVMGGAFPTKVTKGNNPLDKLDWWKYSVVLLSGVAMNFLLIVLAVVAYALGILPAQYTASIANLNALLIFFNLLPFGPMDGGKFVKRFFDSVPEHQDMRYVYGICALAGIGFLLVGLLSGETSFGMFLLLTYGLHKKATTDDPNGSANPLAMNERQELFWAGVYVALFVSSLFIYRLTPDWAF